MKLFDYLKARKISQAAFARMIGKDRVYVHRCVYHKIIPTHDDMLVIYLATQGHVTANDFYELPPLSEPTYIATYR